MATIKELVKEINEYLNPNSLTTKISNLTLSNNTGYTSSSVLSSLFFIDTAGSLARFVLGS